MTRSALMRGAVALSLLAVTVLVSSGTPLYADDGGHTVFVPGMQQSQSDVDIDNAGVDKIDVIVVMHDDVGNPEAVANSIARQNSGSVGFVYRHALKGASMSVPAQAVAGIEHNPNVKFVERDAEVTIAAQALPTGVQRIFADENANIGIDGADDLRVDVDVAVIDTGVDFQHPDLNVVGGVNCVARNPFASSCKNGGDDDHYHGTHVAGSIGAIDNSIGVVGVAPGARIWAVKVLNSNGSGYTSWIVAGIDWVAAHSDTIEVANMSLGGSSYSQAEYEAIQGAVDAGVAFAVAAGNNSAPAANYSPAAFDNVLTVSALSDGDGEPGGLVNPSCRSDEDDTLANFSNYGSAVNVAAPGVCIYSTFPLELGEYGTISGTSMASPHVAGALALLASANDPNNAGDVAALYSSITSSGNYNWSDESGDGILEPLLDVSDLSLFNPAMINTGVQPQPTATPTATATPVESPTATPEPTPDATATPAPTTPTLTVIGTKVRADNVAELHWSGIGTAQVNVYRNDDAPITVENTGFYADSLGKKITGTFNYVVCSVEETSVCTNPDGVTF